MRFYYGLVVQVNVCRVPVQHCAVRVNDAMRRADVTAVFIMVDKDLTQTACVAWVTGCALPNNRGGEASIPDPPPKVELSEQAVKLRTAYRARWWLWHNLGVMTVQLRSETESALASFLDGSLSPQEMELWLVSYLDADVVDAESGALWEMRLLLIEYGEGIRPLADARELATHLLAENAA